jgi:hypothetical protein
MIWPFSVLLGHKTTPKRCHAQKILEFFLKYRNVSKFAHFAFIKDFYPKNIFLDTLKLTVCTYIRHLVLQ